MNARFSDAINRQIVEVTTYRSLWSAPHPTKPEFLLGMAANLIDGRDILTAGQWLQLIDLGLRLHDDHAGAVLAEVRGLLLSKRADYGPDNLERHGQFGILVRINDKIARLQHLWASKAEPRNETVRDTVLDIVGYAICGAIMSAGEWRLPLTEDGEQLALFTEGWAFEARWLCADNSSAVRRVGGGMTSIQASHLLNELLHSPTPPHVIEVWAKHDIYESADEVYGVGFDAHQHLEGDR